MSRLKLPDLSWSKPMAAMLHKVTRLAFVTWAGGTIGTPMPADAAPTWPDGYQARLEVLALIETLNAELLASPSATDTLTQWCKAHHMAEEPRLVARLQRGLVKPISAAQRHDLDIGPDEPVAYRRVELVCGDHILSQADNWYVPARLTPAMNAELSASDVPFGRVIRPLHPHRRTIAVTMFWHPLPQNWEMQSQPDVPIGQKLVIPPLLFEHRAVVYNAAGAPISEVDESYRSELLDFVRAP